ncbi:hypothetical protein [Sinorhizobium medicae]|uniref:hypothetical protein n=1 Tax=Sinorhizobium medicae TaxID=110321 RepID=UPI000401D264|nr:hypothetical protein [Sinorhizobium medicae]RVQ76131.1 hypothetical protein CN244_06380 [Sinorhizobium medicae]
MSAISAVLIAIAENVAAPFVKSILQGKIGRSGDGLVDIVVDKIADKLGVEPEAIAAEPAEKVEAAVREAERAAPEMLALWQAGVEGQFALLQAEQRDGVWPSAWRWGWMYLLGIMWFVRLMIVPVTDALWGTGIAAGIDVGVMMTLTTWFIGLYMGGHTVKALGATAIDAVKAMKARA